MSLYFNYSTPKARADRTNASNRAVFIASLSAIAVLSGCGGPSKPADLSPINNGKLTISANLPTGTEGSGYSGSLTASGGTSPYNYAVTSGQMPQGVNLDRSTGNVSGTPGIRKLQLWRYSFGRKGSFSRERFADQRRAGGCVASTLTAACATTAADHSSTIESTERKRRNAFLEPAESWRLGTVRTRAAEFRGLLTFSV